MYNITVYIRYRRFTYRKVTSIRYHGVNTISFLDHKGKYNKIIFGDDATVMVEEL